MNEAQTQTAALPDTNLIVSSVISPEGHASQVLQAWRNHDFRLVTSAELIAEIVDALERTVIRQRFRVGQSWIDDLLRDMRRLVSQPIPVTDLPLHCRDPKDDKVLACALGASADYIVTGDADLLVLDGHPGLAHLRIVAPSAFLHILYP